jgi:hypothetical protein
MDVRSRQIAAVASIVASALQIDGDLELAEVQAVNAEGWTVDLGAPGGGVVRWEGVVLTPSELAEAWAMAQAWSR